MPGAPRTTRSALHRRFAATARRIAGCALASAAMFAAGSREAHAQSKGDIAAWDALIVSPVGALPPRVRDGLFTDLTRAEFSVRYGRWRYDMDDAIHNSIGVTLGRELGGAHTGITITGAYLASSCGTCSAWLSGAIEVQTRIIQRAIAGDSLHEMVASLGVRGSAGGARYSGEELANAASVTGAASMSLAFPFAWSTRMSVSVLPGVGLGRFSSVDENAYGTRPTLGATVAWAVRSGFVVDFGMQRIFIDGGPSQVGTSLSWVRR
jgi:hypothetical protein